MGAINGARHEPGSGWVQLPRSIDLGSYSGQIVSIRKASELGYWTEAEQKIKKTGRPIGTKNFQGRAYEAKDIKRIFGRIDLAITRGAKIAEAVTKEAIAKEMISIVSAQSGFNDYTGNLKSSYVASIVTSRKITGRVVFDDGGKRRSSIHVGPKGGRYAYLQHPPKHMVRGFRMISKKKNKRYKSIKLLKRDNQIIRYLRKWEREGKRPYIDGSIGPENGTGEKKAKFNIGYLNRGSGKVQSGVVIENTAPYSGAVQHRHYNVLKGAVARTAHGGRWSKNAEKLVRVASIQALKDAGLNIK